MTTTGNQAAVTRVATLRARLSSMSAGHGTRQLLVTTLLGPVDDELQLLGSLLATETPSTQAGACPPSAVADMIVPWPEVLAGDLLVWDGEFRRVERVEPMKCVDVLAYVLDGEHAGIIPAGTYAAVRRYTEG